MSGMREKTVAAPVLWGMLVITIVSLCSPVVFAASSVNARTGVSSPTSPKTQILVGGRKALVWGSQGFESKKGRFAIGNAFDGNGATAWVASDKHGGEGAFIQIEFAEPVSLEGFALRPGLVNDARDFTAHGAPRTVEVQADDRVLGRYTIPYDLSYRVNEEDPSREGCFPTQAVVNLHAPRVVIFSQPEKGRSFRLTITKTIPGNQYNDLAITEWEPLFTDGTSPRMVDPKMMGLLMSVRDERAVEGHLANCPHVEDLRLKYLHKDAGKRYIYVPKSDLLLGLIPREDDFPYVPRVNPKLFSKGDNLEAQFLRYTRHALLNAVVTVESHEGGSHIVGSLSLGHGDGEWLEFYPFIEMNEHFLITSLSEVDVSGASPGCKEVIPSEARRRLNKRNYLQ